MSIPLPLARHGKGTWADKEALSLKNQWLQHLVLASPEREHQGVRLTAVPGLAGVKSLDPDSFMGLAAEMSHSETVMGTRFRWGLLDFKDLGGSKGFERILHGCC